MNGPAVQQPEDRLPPGGPRPLQAMPIRRGGLGVRLAETEAEVAAAQELRHRAFLAARGRAGAGLRDADHFDAQCAHMLLMRDDRPVGCFRLQLFDGPAIEHSYSAQFYDLTCLAAYAAPMLEIGRFCLSADQNQPDLLRLAWASIAAVVDAQGVGLLFGCSSLPGADPARHGPALAVLQARIGPDLWRPGRRAARIVPLHGQPCAQPAGEAPNGLPPLLRSYLGLGGWVSDHAVVDTVLDTLHVFTGVEIAKIPPARARALRLIASESVG